MIRTLLVDDEPIVRKGLMHIMPWGSHGFEIVADAGSGQKALELLGSDSFDLLVTDLTMPGMSGFELIQEVKDKHPQLSIAILTCHQDFRYVQEALRLGALDYIVKTELDDEKLDSIFSRISAQVGEKLSRMKQDRAAPAPSGLLFIGLRDDCSRQELYAQTWMGERTIYGVAGCDHVWYIEWGETEPKDSSLIMSTMEDSGHPRWILVRMHQMVFRESALPHYVKRVAFYEIRSLFGGVVVHESLRDSWSEEPKSCRGWLACWDKFEWVFHDRALEHLLSSIENDRPEPVKLAAELFNTMSAWKSALGVKSLAQFQNEALKLALWQEWKQWLLRLRACIREAMEHRGAGEEISLRTLQAIRYVSRRLDEGITQEDVATAVHLSRGYFSDCFKRAAGCTFNEYMKELRIDRAARLLATSNHEVQVVAQLCGFQDESYFRKLFREATGSTPKEYRKLTSPWQYSLSVIGLNDKEKVVRPDENIVR